jgi:predicted nucleotidyltransferase
MPGVSSGKSIDPVTRNALASFQKMLIARYGQQMKAFYLFGSRARGDHRPDSDVDVAVFLDHVTDPVGEQLALIDEGYDILLETGVSIQPWIFDGESLADPGHYPAPDLVTKIRREGVRL